VQRGIAEPRSRLAQLEAALAAAKAAQKKAADQQAAKEKALTFDGYMQMRYQDDGSQSGMNQFYIRRARFNFGEDVIRSWRFQRRRGQCKRRQ
jgi:hypothetical protein